MNIAVYFQKPMASEFTGTQRFIVETLFLLIQHQTKHRFIIITDKRYSEQFSSYPNTEIVIIKPLPKNALLKKIWRDVKLPGILRETGSDIFISVENFCSLVTPIPQCIVIDNVRKTRISYIKKAKLMLVPNKLMKDELVKKHEIHEERIAVIYPSPNKTYEVINTEEKEVIKNKYSDDKEFFLFNSIFSGREDLINLLKSFSHFKKRQQSNFKLLLTAQSNSFFEKSLTDYKYRNDVRFINAIDIKELVLITASAYAVVLPFNENDNMVATLNAMRSGVPVIAVKNSVVNEIANGAALYAETNAIKDVGEKMMQLYTDENHRSQLIEKGKQAAANYTDEKATELLWQSILKVLE